MEILTYISAEKNNDAQMETLYTLWIPYMREIYRDDPEFADTDEELKEGVRQRIMAAAARKDMFFELVCDGNQNYVGFLFYAVDHGGIPGVLPAGLGYIMEVYVAPEYRRRGFATQMYRHMMEQFHALHTEHFYLTPDSANGIPFWTAMGFRDSGLTDPDNRMPIYTMSASEEGTCLHVSDERRMSIMNEVHDIMSASESSCLRASEEKCR